MVRPEESSRGVVTRRRIGKAGEVGHGVLVGRGDVSFADHLGSSARRRLARDLIFAGRQCDAAADACKRFKLETFSSRPRQKTNTACAGRLQAIPITMLFSPPRTPLDN